VVEEDNFFALLPPICGGISIILRRIKYYNITAIFKKTILFFKIAVNIDLID
jgi:hypothetical protein